MAADSIAIGLLGIGDLAGGFADQVLRGGQIGVAALVDAGAGGLCHGDARSQHGEQGDGVGPDGHFSGLPQLIPARVRSYAAAVLRDDEWTRRPDRGREKGRCPIGTAPFRSAKSLRRRSVSGGERGLAAAHRGPRQAKARDQHRPAGRFRDRLRRQREIVEAPALVVAVLEAGPVGVEREEEAAGAVRNDEIVMDDLVVPAGVAEVRSERRQRAGAENVVAARGDRHRINAGRAIDVDVHVVGGAAIAVVAVPAVDEHQIERQLERIVRAKAIGGEGRRAGGGVAVELRAEARTGTGAFDAAAAEGDRQRRPGERTGRIEIGAFETGRPDIDIGGRSRSGHEAGGERQRGEHLHLGGSPG